MQFGVKREHRNGAVLIWYGGMRSVASQVNDMIKLGFTNDGSLASTEKPRHWLFCARNVRFYVSSSTPSILATLGGEQ